MKLHLTAGAVLVAFSLTSGLLIAVAPPFATFATAVGIAIAWCLWLENHRDGIESGQTPPASGAMPRIAGQTLLTKTSSR